jgi:phosphoesterase RecJ-like protein
MHKTATQVYEMSEIKGCPIWVIITEKGSDNLTMRVRSRVIPVNEICARFGGGGHDNACGIKVKTRNEVKEVLMTLDRELKLYKSRNGNIL